MASEVEAADPWVPSPADRDVEYIRRWMPFAELANRLYFRVRSSGLGNIPPTGPVLFVGNHSGGLMTPDTIVAAGCFWSTCGPERPAYALVHPSVFAFPGMGRHIARVGGLPATPRMAQQVLEAGASLLVYPGAGEEAYRPYSERHRVKLGRRSSYIRLAMRYGTPIVPVVCLGGHDTLIVIDDGESRARSLGLDKVGVERLPLTYSWPHGLTLGANYNLPFPARIDICFDAPIHLTGFEKAASRTAAAVDWCHATVEGRMQQVLDELVAARQRERARKALRG
ncbi:lysophospholipid acyltransferase family protein [Sphingomonas arenae]|uniref:lysophospholipid acyltransferase family protein n=1 Tax=Sphingomonas arenae TaxID=2812555 RepID=UPI001967DE03|nr:lysophospholipid acyltransferase family protein [Sphingomonas arenae]